ncbi:hypothetical protein JNB_18158 [Janibacter sp. HTCC2649]|nr:hypothetical protein JNB_18158 [Janibacter sp. HTCC2649]
MATSGEAKWREALLAAGPGARLGGMTALESDGLTGYIEPVIHIWVPKGHENQPLSGVRLHETRRWTAKDATDAILIRSSTRSQGSCARAVGRADPSPRARLRLRMRWF